MIRNALRRLWPPPFKPTWDGIYGHLRDVPADGLGYGDNQVAGGVAAFAKQALERQRSGADPSLWHDALAVLAGAVASQRGAVDVLDFGGGVGTAYIQLLASLPSDARLNVRVVDQEQMCAAGEQLFAGDTRISFENSLDGIQKMPDIVYANSVLPYIDDYTGLLKRLAGLGSQWILLGRLAGGRYPTYATRQLNIAGRVLPYWFHNADEIKNILLGCGYAVSYVGLTGPEYDQRNFPVTHRVGRMRNVLFCKSGVRE